MKNSSLGTTAKIQEAIGQSDRFLEVQERLSRIAKVERPVLIIGERGTGKELAAARIHYLSNRWQNALVEMNCAALNPSLIESELFGHESGAFTGASYQRKGKFEMAHEGTLFLDEIGNMPMVVQEKILRVIEYSSFERVGGSRPIQVNVRIVSATNADLPVLAQKGDFKQDLLDRLSFEVVYLPSLRERKEDILLLANHFAAQMAVELGLSSPPSFAPAIVEELLHYNWPGNIRELKNVIERAVYQVPSDPIAEIVINPFAESQTQSSPSTDLDEKVSESSVNSLIDLQTPYKEAARDLELTYLSQALIKANYNQRKAAEILGLTYHQFRGLYRKYKNNLSSNQNKLD